jgi:hypothetical protein
VKNQKAMSWEDRTCFQKFLLLVAIVTVLLLLTVFAANIVAAVHRTTSDCDGLSGPQKETCQKYGCGDCNVWDATLYYIIRVYCLVFSILGVVAEFPKFKFFREAFKIFRYFWGRGFLHVFLGILTLQSHNNNSQGENLWIDIISCVLIGCGFFHFILSCACFKQSNKGMEDDEVGGGSYTAASGI